MEKIIAILILSFLLFFVLEHSKLSSKPDGSVDPREWSSDNYGSSWNSYNRRYNSVFEKESLEVSFYYETIFNHSCKIKVKVDPRTERYDYNLRWNPWMSGMYADPTFIDRELLFLKGALYDVRTVFLLGFLFDYDNL
jgi:hypothetical protein